MDKFWIDKLRDLKTRLKNHLAEKARFEAKPGRSSLDDLRTGQRLKREDDQIASHFAQLAEFATGVPAEKYKFKLEIQSAFLSTRKGVTYFGPSALLEHEPFVNFDPHEIFAKNQREKPEKITEQQIEKKTEKPKKVSQPGYEKILSFSEKIVSKHKLPLATIRETKPIVPEKPPGMLDRLEKFVEKISSVGNYIDSIVNKYKPEPAESPQPSKFYIYVGDFVYLSRRGKWAKVKTTILSQKDYFAEKFLSRPEIAGKHPLSVEEGELETVDAAELITDEYAEPVASSTAELGLGYFIPLRRVGRGKPPQADLKRLQTGIEKQFESLPVLGSDEFVSDVMQRAESSGQPVQEISPTYISTTGRKIDRARSFAGAIKNKLQLPKSEPVRKAVLALLPTLEGIIQKTDREGKPEDALLEVERDFDDLVAIHTRPFRVAQKASTPASEWSRTGTTRLGRTFMPPQEDSLGVIRKYLPEIASPARASLGLISTAMSAQERQVRAPLLIHQTQAISVPDLRMPSVTAEHRESRVARNLRADDAKQSSLALHGMPGVLGTLSSMASRSGIGGQLQSILPGAAGAFSALTGMGGDVSGFARGLIGRATSGILGRVSPGLTGGLAQAFFSRRLPSGLSGLTSGIGSLLNRGRSSGVTGLLGGAQSTLAGPGSAVQSDELGGLLNSGRAAVGNLFGGGSSSLERVSELVTAGLGGLGGGFSGVSGLTGLLPTGTSRVGSLLSSATSGGLGGAVTSLLPGGAGGLLSRAAGGPSGLLGGRAEGLLSSITGGQSGSVLGSLGQRAGAMASDLLSRVGLPSAGGISQMASRALGGLTGSGSSPLGSLISGAGSAVSGLTSGAGGQSSGLISGLTGGGSGSGLLSGIRSGVSGVASGLGSRVGEMASGLGERVSGIASGIGARVSGLSSGIGGRVSSMAHGLASGGSSLVARANSAASGMGGIGSLAQQASDLSGSISGIAAQAGQMIGGESSPLSGIGAVGAALPRLSGISSAAQGAVQGIGQRMPSIGGGIADMSSSASRAVQSAAGQIPAQLPRGWNRPPFEVGDAIQRTIRSAAPEQVGTLARRTQSALSDYGLSVIDLDETSVNSLRSPAEQMEEMSEIDLDDETMEAIYFRLQRIFETENERVGGES